MKKSLMIAASLTISGAAVAQSNMSGASSSPSGYPACSRTVTDSCIQLHERGVTASDDMAMSVQTNSEAVGGPYEPIATHSSSSMSHDMPFGVGGPVEQRGGYPPCRRTGPGEDSCIQLHERGVTGAGN